MVTAVLAETENALTANVALLAPAATTTLAGTAATLEFVLESVTSAPPEGATPVRVTVPVDVLPLATEVGLSARLEVVGLLTVNTAVCVPLYDAEIVTETGETTANVVIAKVP